VGARHPASRCRARQHRGSVERRPRETRTRDATEFRAEISSPVGGSRRLPGPLHIGPERRNRDGIRRGQTQARKFRSQLLGQQQWGSAAANPVKGAVPGCTRRASLIRPPPVTSRPLGLAAITRGDPLRIERVKEMYLRRRIPVNPSPRHNRDRRHTQGPGGAETARSRPLARYHTWWRSPIQGRHNESRRRSIPMTHLGPTADGTSSGHSSWNSQSKSKPRSVDLPVGDRRGYGESAL